MLMPMPEGIFSRNELIWGEAVQSKLAKKHAAIFGLGGVGGYAAESLARCGVGELTLVDFDCVGVSNINRQLVALNSTVGTKKIELFKARLTDINPDIKLNCFDNFYEKGLNEKIFLSTLRHTERSEVSHSLSEFDRGRLSTNIDFVIDAIDTVHSKIELLQYCHGHGIPVITSLGAGNRLDPTQLYICDLGDLKKVKCNFAKNIIIKLNNIGITDGITVVMSHEKPKSPEKKLLSTSCVKIEGKTAEINKISPGSVPFVPAVAGFYMGYWAVKEMVGL